ncbi:MAG: hypothetical protein PHI97_20910 [Desulfobulbus sp.]|nr:hypothetical protein [Desulfobulbus sp.]
MAYDMLHACCTLHLKHKDVGSVAGQPLLSSGRQPADTVNFTDNNYSAISR